MFDPILQEDKFMAADIETRLVDLENKVRELNDREALRDLRYRYHEYINEGRFAEIVDLFAEDGELEFGPLGKAEGRYQIKVFFANLGPSASPPASARGPHFTFVKQYIHNHIVEIHGDWAKGFSYLEAKPVIDGEAYLVSGKYSDEYARLDGQWRFTSMNFTPHFIVRHKDGWAQDERIKIPKT
jgi:SnoaL-like domain